MLHLADALLPDALLNGLRDLCDAHADLLDEHDGDACSAGNLKRAMPDPCTVISISC